MTETGPTCTIPALPLHRFIDHTFLKPEGTQQDIDRTCQEALQHDFKAVCVRSEWVGRAAQLLQGSSTLPICVVGFPLGEDATESKAAETRRAIAAGAQEIDTVLKKSALRVADYRAVLSDIQAVVDAAQGRPVKVILETGELTRDEKLMACALASAAGASFVKTSTGFGKGGATIEDIRLMREVVGPRLGVKASGGVRTRADALAMIEAGATRIGTSNGVAIVQGLAAGAGY